MENQSEQENNVGSDLSLDPVDHSIVLTNKNVDSSLLSDDEYFKNMPPGYRFKPTPQELIIHYLRKKINNKKLPRNRIYDANVYNFDPKQLRRDYRKSEDENEWFFLTSRMKKYRNGSRPDRAAGAGYWKATGSDKNIEYNGEAVGFQKSLVYYKGRPPGTKTTWIMQEYRLKETEERPRASRDDMELDACVLCKIYKKKKPVPKNNRNQQNDGNNPVEKIGEDENEDHTTLKEDSLQRSEDSCLNEKENTATGSSSQPDMNANHYNAKATHQNLGAFHHMGPQMGPLSMNATTPMVTMAPVYGRLPSHRPSLRRMPQYVELPPLPSSLGDNMPNNHEDATISTHATTSRGVGGTLPAYNSVLPDLPFTSHFIGGNVGAPTDYRMFPFTPNYFVGNENVSTFNYVGPSTMQCPSMSMPPNHSIMASYVTTVDSMRHTPMEPHDALPEVSSIDNDETWNWLVDEDMNIRQDETITDTRSTELSSSLPANYYHAG